MRAIALGGLFVLTVLGCASAGGRERSCVEDTECSSNQICFVDGCGDPGANVFVEVRGSPQLGYYEQDFPTEVAAQVDFELGTPLQLKGTLQQYQEDIADPTRVNSYSDEVQVRAVGQSELIPGLQRAYESRIARPEQGFFTMALGAGQFTVTATPADRSIPPLVVTDVQVRSDGGITQGLVYVFPSTAGALTLTGRLVKGADALGNDLFVTEAAMELQALDPLTRLPLSQRVQASSGNAGSTGEFTLPINPEARRLPAVEFRVTPKDPAALVPSRSFIVETPLQSGLSLKLGEFGAPVRELAGTVLDKDGVPVAEALVVFKGPTVGGGEFQSRTVVTDIEGNFVVDLLPPPTGMSLTMTVVPPPGSAAALTETAVRVKDDGFGKLVLNPAEVRCQRRVLVTGVVFRPDGLPAAGIKLQAVELASDQVRLLPLETVGVETDERGAYSLHLDAGDWRLDYLPLGDIARSSRLLKLKPTSLLVGDPKPVEFPDLTLPRGRKVTGQVTASMATRSGAPMPYAGLRFFHVGPVEGKDTAVLLGEAVADSTGHYSVVLPTR